MEDRYKLEIVLPNKVSYYCVTNNLRTFYNFLSQIDMEVFNLVRNSEKFGVDESSD